MLAYKLKFVLDRTGRVYAQETARAPDGPHYTVYRGDLGRIVIGKKGDGSRKDAWLFTADTVNHIERDVPRGGRSAAGYVGRDMPSVHRPPDFWEVPGLWVRHPRRRAARDALRPARSLPMGRAGAGNAADRHVCPTLCWA